ncbi:MAG TPA: hypothetical protein VIY47_17040 [Ignavibacteriaceae bacterium]
MKLRILIPALLSMVFASTAFAAEGDGSLPPNPTPGQCYIHKFYPPTWETGQISVIIKDGFKKLELIPAVFKDETVNVTVRDAFDDIKITPATFKTVTERIEIQPAENYWKVDCCPQKPHHYKGSDRDWKKSCEQACFKSNPPVFKTITKQILDKDAADTRTIIPPEVRAIVIKRLVTPPSIKVTQVPPETMNFTTKKLVQPGYMKWEEGTCGKYTCDPKELKAALKLNGYYAGAMTPEITPDVITAMNKFRADKGLGQHDELDKETALALGITGYVK